MAALTNKLIDGHETPSRSISLLLALPLAREFLPFFCYLGDGPLARLHSLSYLFIFRGGFLTAAHSLVPFRHGSGVIAHHALGQLPVGKNIFINISVLFLHGEGGEYPFELAVATVGARWRGRR
jgi:hypothetical protein